jgi:hypothetical protein
MARVAFYVVGAVMLAAQTVALVVMWRDLGEFDWGLIVGYVLPVGWFVLGRDQLQR